MVGWLETRSLSKAAVARRRQVQHQGNRGGRSAARFTSRIGRLEVGQQVLAAECLLTFNLSGREQTGRGFGGYPGFNNPATPDLCSEGSACHQTEAPPSRTIIGGFLGHEHVVNMALAHARIADPNKLCALAQFLEIRRTDIAHAGL